MLPRPLSPEAAAGMKLLLVRLGAVGDVVRSLPLAHALARTHPGLSLGWLVEDVSAPLLREIRCLDAVHVLPRRELVRALRRPAQLARALGHLRGTFRSVRKRRYDLVLDIHGTFKAAWAAWLSNAPVAGLAPGGSKELAHHFYDEILPFPTRPMTRIERALFAGAAAGLLGEDPPLPSEALVEFGLTFDPARVTRITAVLAASPRRPVVLFPFASASGQAKRWPIERHADLGARIAARGHRVLLAWGSQREQVEAAAAMATAAGVELAPPTDLVELTELLRGASVLVTGDTGPMHLAAAVGTPVVALFGPSDPVINRPWGRPGRHGHAVIVRHPLASLPVEDVLPLVLERVEA